MKISGDVQSYIKTKGEIKYVAKSIQIYYKIIIILG